jgi:hypothetical protein
MLHYTINNTIYRSKKTKLKNVNFSFRYKIYTKTGIKLKQATLEENSIPVIQTGLKDKNAKDIYLYDVLESTEYAEEKIQYIIKRGKFKGRLVNEIIKKKVRNFYICIFDAKKGKIDFLLYNEEMRYFEWIDDYVHSSLSVIGNGIESLQNTRRKSKIPRDKILSIINATDQYFHPELSDY